MGSEIRPLTGLRGVAALYVVMYHFCQGSPGGDPLNTALQHGYLAVDLFFVLSGFVLALVHGRDSFEGAGYRDFLSRRFARLYPLYVVVTVATLALLLVEGGAAPSPAHLLLNVLLLQAWGFGTSVVPPSWSLSTEVAAYLLFPLLCGALLWGPRLQAAGLAGLFALLLVFVSLHSPVTREGPLDLYQGHTVAPLVRCLCEFGLGIVAFRASRSRTGRRLARSAPAAALAPALLILLCVPRADLAVVLLGVLLVPTLAVAPDAAAGGLLSAGPVHWLGTVSFSVYLVHFLVREQVRDPLAARLATWGWPQPAGLADLLALAVVLALAQCTFRFVEQPARLAMRSRWTPTAA